ncbi:MAG TPA: SDR family NAD(P)-dependent oxidoreductase [Steroidobacteraceae bacterium]
MGIIRGTAVDHGGSGGGLTVPSEISQERVIRRALERAQINPLEVSYVEAHGTGTSLGDPIEIAALASVYGAKRDLTQPLLVGSVKTNIGHLESAAGVAGLIKLLLSFQEQTIPASLHFTRPNPHIPWSTIPVRVAVDAVPWPAGSQRRIAGLSAFGFSGTNAHVIVEEPPVTQTEPSASTVRRNLLLLSAKSADALRHLSRSYEALLEQTPTAGHSALTYAAATGRGHFSWRQARVLPSERLFEGQADSTRPFRLAFVFNGKAASSAALELYATEPAFRQAFTACHASMEDLNLEVGKFATAYAWAELWKSWGVRPYVLMGRGNGEYVAAVLAGVLSLEDALRLLAARGDPDGFQQILRGMRLSDPSVRLISYTTGTEVSGVAATAEHWIRLLRPPQKPTGAMRTLQELSIDAILPTPRVGSPLERSLATLYTQGLDPDWQAFFGRRNRYPAITLPNYPFERKRIWLDLRQHAAPSGAPALYQIQWQTPSLPPQPVSRAETCHWLILTDTGGTGESLAVALREQGASYTLAYAKDHSGPAAWHTLLNQAGAQQCRIVYLWGLDSSQELDTSCKTFLELWQATGRWAAESACKIWLVTRDAVEAGDSPQLSGVSQAALWGLARGALLEHPERWGALIDLDRTRPDAEAGQLLVEMLSDGVEDQVALRDGQRHVARIAPVTETAVTTTLHVEAAATYLITGGLGFCGLTLAQWLAARGARSLILASRQSPGARSQQALADLRAQGVTVRCEQLDIADPNRVAALFNTLKREAIALRGIIHAAGVLGHKPLDSIDSQELTDVLRPKVSGAWLLHEHSRDFPLDFFVLFSSIASSWGSREQAHYIAANRFLDALAHHRRHLNLPALSLNWGPWDEGGMTSAENRGLLSLIGVHPMKPERALQVLEHLPPLPQIAAAEVDWSLYSAAFEMRGRKPLLDLVRPQQAAPVIDNTALTQLRALPDPDRKRQIAATIEGELRRVLGFGAADTLDVTLGFFQLGMDSLMAIELRKGLEKSLGMSFPVTALFDHPSLNALTEALTDLIGSQKNPMRPREHAELPPPVAPPRQDSDPTAIAIIGMGCRFPGGADDLASYWQLLHDGVDAISEVPAGRWKVDDPYCHYGGFLHDIDQFDAPFFHISPREASCMDPQQRLLLEVSYEALEHAGIPTDQLRGSLTGVFVSLTTNDYATLQLRSSASSSIDGYFFTGNPLNAAAGRISYVLGTHGPSMVIDTACSASLVAIHTACQNLRSRECDLALAGGANLILCPDNTQVVSRTGALARDGRCKAFDASADGFVRSEGCGVLVLKRLTDALACGDRVLAVIRGSAVNHGGATAGFSAPMPCPRKLSSARHSVVSLPSRSTM